MDIPKPPAGAEAIGTVAGQAAVPPAGSADAKPSIFISHCTVQGQVDEIGQRLHALLKAELFAGSDEHTRRAVFFTGHVAGGMRAGDDFKTMLDALQAARVVIAVVTIGTKDSVAMLAEMSVAYSQNKLLPVATRGNYRQRLTWPFHAIHAPSLDNAADVRGLLVDLASRAGLPYAPDAQTEQRCLALAQWVREKYQEIASAERRLKRKMVVGGVVGGLLAVLGCTAFYFLGLSSGQSQDITLRQGAEIKIDDLPVCVAFQGTLPRRYLSKRMREVYETLYNPDHTEEADCQGQIVASDVPGADEETVRQVFLQAMRLSGGLGMLADPADRAAAEALVKRWTKDDRALAQPVEGDECSRRGTALDHDWCKLVKTRLDERARKSFDDAEYAILRVGNKVTAIAARKRVADHPKWFVRSVRSVIVEVKP
jgi:hypothetical protein